MRGNFRLTMVAPSAGENAPIPSLSMATLAAMTPAEAEIQYKDELVRPLDLDKDLNGADLVAVTCSSRTAYRSYEIAAACKTKGIPVVLGGIHPTCLPEEAGEHADAVVVGEAEGLWPGLVSDFQQGHLARLYKREFFPDPEEIPRPRRDIYRAKDYFPIDPVQATRGCPHECEFCSVQRFFGGGRRSRPLQEVLAEIQSLPHRTVLFSDDNLVGMPRYSQRLLKALVPLRKRWVGQASLAGLEDESMIRLLKRSGCLGLLIGFESLSRENLTTMGKYQNRPGHYRRIIEALHRNGIAVWASFMFGLDYDDPGTFERTVRFAVDAKLFSAFFAILMPYPGTALYERLKTENRLTDETWWLNQQQEAGVPYFRPMGMTREELLEGWKWAWKEFYSYRAIGRRFQWEYPPTVANKGVYFPFNFVQHRFVQRKILDGETLGWSKVPWRRFSG